MFTPFLYKMYMNDGCIITLLNENGHIFFLRPLCPIRVCGPRPYFKPGVDTPRDVAARVFEAEMNKEIGEIRMGR